MTPDWQFVSDRVMGGVSAGAIARETVAGRDATVLRGTVSLENNGGFIQMATDVPPPPGDATGIEIEVLGDGGHYELRLRTDALTRPWQSYRFAFEAPPEWQTLRIGFESFSAHRTDAPFEPDRIRRIGMLSIGEPRRAKVAVAALRYFTAA